ncbi:MAG: winged helix-turn-helix domain-containing protein, partial [Promethearchaeota archaeon]
MTTQDTTTEEPQHQDVLTFHSKPVKIIRDEKLAKLLKEQAYYLIVKVLRKGPMTVREIEKAYRKEALSCEGCEPKSDKTIYRYLKVLEDADLVVPAGQRVVIGKTATETLFARTARIFLLHSADKPSWWFEKEGEKIAAKVGALLAHLLDVKTHSVKCLQEAFQELDKAREQELERLVATAGDKALEYMTEGEFKEIDKIV